MAQGISDPHLRAELACSDGHGQLLAAYFRTEWPPCPDVLKSLSRHLDGSENWSLCFVVRNGPTPKARSGSLWEAGQESRLSILLYLVGEGLTNCSIPESDIPIVQKFLGELANALDPKGTGRWKLRFDRPRRGKPSSEIKRALRMAECGHRDLDLYAELGNWRKVDEKVDEGKNEATDRSKSRKAAVRFVRKYRK